MQAALQQNQTLLTEELAESKQAQVEASRLQTALEQNQTLLTEELAAAKAQLKAEAKSQVTAMAVV